MPVLIAKNALRYASRDLAAGERFDASDSDAFVLVVAGKADRVQDGGEQAAPSQAPDQPPRRRYHRRDMRPRD